MAKAFFDDLEVGATGEEPGGVGMTEVVDAGRPSEVGGGSVPLADGLR